MTGNNGTTHWETCWKEPRHHDCAVGLIERQSLAIADLADKLRQARIESYRRGQKRIGRCRDCSKRAVKGRRSCQTHLDKARARKANHYKKIHPEKEVA